MRTYEIKFEGKDMDTVGITRTITERVEASSQASAVLGLYEKYDVIEVHSVEEEKGSNPWLDNASRGQEAFLRSRATNPNIAFGPDAIEVIHGDITNGFGFDETFEIGRENEPEYSEPIGEEKQANRGVN